MAGKRYDQYRLDPREGGATDYKNLPQKGHGADTRDNTAEIDKQQLAQNETRAQGQPLPPNVPAPSQFVKTGTKDNDQGTDNEIASGAGHGG